MKIEDVAVLEISTSDMESAPGSFGALVSQSANPMLAGPQTGLRLVLAYAAE
ncbi:hypothetical protein ACIBG0_37050 [Nocardia sp. NPDC050630]|uniref:hypothetical protein n=1 Tax=Nocardia sp. NPDC050630 TaxID=3364321 RepID=UPI0037A57979